MYLLHLIKGLEPGPIIECFKQEDLEDVAQDVMTANLVYTHAVLFGPDGTCRAYIYPTQRQQAA